MSVEIALPSTPDWSHPHLAGFAQSGLLCRDIALADAVARSRGRLCFLATPYSNVCVTENGDWNQGESLFCASRAARWVRAFAVEGVTAIAPIIQAVEMIHVDFDEWLEPLDTDFWGCWCRPLLDACGPVIVPPLKGWQECLGIWHAVAIALRGNRPVYLIDPATPPDIAKWFDA